MDDSITEPAAEVKQKPLLLLLFYSLLLYNGGYVICETLRWSNPLEGFLNGLVHSLFLSIPWAIVVLPWSLVVAALYQWRKWRRFRTVWILGPAILALVVHLGELVVHPPTARGRFHTFTKTELPGEIDDLRTHFFGGGFVDYSHTYSFNTTPEETGRLIREMHLKEQDVLRDRDTGELLLISVPQQEGWPVFADWEGLAIYRRDDGHWFRYLLTDGSRTRVYIFLCCT